jgi:hypothetical protein
MPRPGSWTLTLKWLDPARNSNVHRPPPPPGTLRTLRTLSTLWGAQAAHVRAYPRKDRQSLPTPPETSTACALPRRDRQSLPIPPETSPACAHPRRDRQSLPTPPETSPACALPRRDRQSLPTLPTNLQDLTTPAPSILEPPLPMHTRETPRTPRTLRTLRTLRTAETIFGPVGKLTPKHSFPARVVSGPAK